MDITEKRTTEIKLKEIEEGRLQDVLSAVINAQEEERTHIAEVLHNEFGQLLSVAKMKIPVECTEAAGLVNQAIVQMRSIAYELMPDILSDFGLEFALKDMCDKKMSEAGIKCSVTIKGLGERIKPLMEVAVYRILQELLNNIIKHSKADQVSLSVVRKSAGLYLNLTDNGIGFHIQNKIESSKTGFGLKYIMNRVQMHKGTLKVTALDRGSVVSIEIPLVNSGE
jgi:signal transduction histidine kinase